MGYIPRIFAKYKSEVATALREEFKYSNAMQIPKMEKVILNMGIKEANADVKLLEQIAHEVSQITGQKPVVTKAKKSISTFKVRKGFPVGLKVTLRRSRMYEFMDRLFSIAMPRIRDFQGYSERGFDGRGNLTIGLKEQTIFPEVVFDQIKKVQGMDITFVTTATTDQEGKRLLELLGFPFRKRG